MRLRSLAAALVVLVSFSTPALAEYNWSIFARDGEPPENVLRMSNKGKAGKTSAAAEAEVPAKPEPELVKTPVRYLSKWAPESVPFTGYRRGTIVIDTKERYLYLVENAFTARRYKVAVGREGLLFTGRAKVGDMQEWPRWIPTAAMIERDPKRYAQYKDGMDGGPSNPLGARAIYLHQDRIDTHIRIHGTNAPETIGSASSNGCFRMLNEHVMEIYERVKMGAEVVVL